MENCLVTKLKSKVNNDELHVLNAWRLYVAYSSSPTADKKKIHIQGPLGTTFKVKSYGNVLLGSTYGNSDYGQEFTSQNHDVTFYVSNNDGYIDIISKYRILFLDLYSKSDVFFDVADLNYSTAIRVGLVGNQASGSVKAVGNLKDLISDSTITAFKAPKSEIIGDVSLFAKNMPNIEDLSIWGSSYITGTVESFVEQMPVRTVGTTIGMYIAYTKITLHGASVDSPFKVVVTSNGVDIKNSGLTTTLASWNRSTGVWTYPE